MWRWRTLEVVYSRAFPRCLPRIERDMAGIVGFLSAQCTSHEDNQHESDDIDRFLMLYFLRMLRTSRKIKQDMVCLPRTLTPTRLLFALLTDFVITNKYFVSIDQ